MPDINLTEAEIATQRTKDLHMLGFLIDHGFQLVPRELEAFEDMSKRLKERPTTVLSKAQRGMVFALCRKVSPSGEGWDDDGLSPAERNRNVPRGKEVPTPAVLQNLPLKPPRRNKAE